MYRLEDVEEYEREQIRASAADHQGPGRRRRRRQAVQGLQRLTGSADIRPLQILSKAVEQVQYYHRHHEKYLAGRYHKDAPLDGFADALSAESPVVRILGGEVRELCR